MSIDWLEDASAFMGKALDVAKTREERRFVDAETQQREILNEVEQKVPAAVQEVAPNVGAANAPIIAGVSNKTLLIGGAAFVGLILVVAVVK